MMLYDVMCSKMFCFDVLLKDHNFLFKKAVGKKRFEEREENNELDRIIVIILSFPHKKIE